MTIYALVVKHSVVYTFIAIDIKCCLWYCNELGTRQKLGELNGLSDITVMQVTTLS